MDGRPHACGYAGPQIHHTSPRALISLRLSTSSPLSSPLISRTLFDSLPRAHDARAREIEYSTGKGGRAEGLKCASGLGMRDFFLYGPRTNKAPVSAFFETQGGRRGCPLRSAPEAGAREELGKQELCHRSDQIRVTQREFILLPAVRTPQASAPPYRDPSSWTRSVRGPMTLGFRLPSTELHYARPSLRSLQNGSAPFCAPSKAAGGLYHYGAVAHQRVWSLAVRLPPRHRVFFQHRPELETLEQARRTGHPGRFPPHLLFCTPPFLNLGGPKRSTLPWRGLPEVERGYSDLLNSASKLCRINRVRERPYGRLDDNGTMMYRIQMDQGEG